MFSLSFPQLVMLPLSLSVDLLGCNCHSDRSPLEYSMSNATLWSFLVAHWLMGYFTKSTAFTKSTLFKPLQRMTRSNNFSDSKLISFLLELFDYKNIFLLIDNMVPQIVLKRVNPTVPWRGPHTEYLTLLHVNHLNVIYWGHLLRSHLKLLEFLFQKSVVDSFTMFMFGLL